MQVVNISSDPRFQLGQQCAAVANIVANVVANIKEFPPFRLDPVNQCLWRRGTGRADERILLKPKPFAVLQYLVDNPGRLVTQEELLDAVWPDTHVQPEVLKRHVFDIRDVLGDDSKNPTYIETHPRRGYQFVAQMRNTGTAQSAPAVLPQTTLVGRGSALSELQDSLAKAMTGQRQIVFVTGEPGIGKTTLVDEFQRQASQLGEIRIGRGQCVEGYGGKEAYYAILEAVANLCRGPQGESVVQILATQAPTWLVQFPAFLRREQREILQREIQGDTRQRMLREIVDALEGIASQSPLLLVLEDLHWADPSTVDLISALARRRNPAKLMLVGTFRPVDIALADHPLRTVKQDLFMHRLVSELPLEPLDEREVAAYLARESKDGCAPNELVRLLHRHSDGNPMFMVSVLDHMAQRGVVARENGKWELKAPAEKITLETPENLRLMLEAQIERLGAEEQQALEVASVNGTLFSAGVNSGLAGLDEEKFEKLCDEMSRRQGVVRRQGSRQFPDGTVSPRYQFVHALYREVIYSRLSPGRRAKLHLQVGERIESLYGQRSDEAVNELARHFEAGGDWLRAQKYRRMVGDKDAERQEPGQVVEIRGRNRSQKERSSPNLLLAVQSSYGISSASAS